MVHACTKSQSLNKQGIQKNCVPEFPILSTLKNYPHVYLWFYNGINTYEGIPKHSWKKIVQLLWTVVTYLLKKC